MVLLALGLSALLCRCWLREVLAMPEALEDGALNPLTLRGPQCPLLLLCQPCLRLLKAEPAKHIFSFLSDLWLLRTRSFLSSWPKGSGRLFHTKKSEPIRPALLSQTNYELCYSAMKIMRSRSNALSLTRITAV